MQTNVSFTIKREHVNQEVQSNGTHTIRVRVDAENRDVYLECSSRESLFEFGRTLMEEALYGSGWAEFYPLGTDEKWLVVNGARLVKDSSRIFIQFPEEGKHTA